ncbi:protein of unknown function DUF710 [Thermaerobacter marianensis DSM 12885]|uniref:Cell division protein ZapA n=1 Tax=Thermaerobacter marianensis (strain ATCC 700841 / DSM 12885 / JCM 10246 / 7p75a) TaxID=644966 RepID=E6SIV7_THEM7|nr:cell division protein ZapA [Thermaerobacter marianensis]ADU50952.1 protein of unknown function DUF710 [Thermaerobacter marianensis DSM 12885]
MRDVPPAGSRDGEETTHRVTVKIFGEEYVLRGDARPAYMERLADMVDRRMNEIAKRHPRLGITRIAVLAAINLADELSKLEEQYQRVLGMLEREWDRRKRELNGRPGGGGAPGSGGTPAAGGAGAAVAPQAGGPAPGVTAPPPAAAAAEAAGGPMPEGTPSPNGPAAGGAGTTPTPPERAGFGGDGR